MIIKKILWFSYLPIDLIIIFISTFTSKLEGDSELVKGKWKKIYYRLKFSYRLARQIAYGRCGIDIEDKELIDRIEKYLND